MLYLRAILLAIILIFGGGQLLSQAENSFPPNDRELMDIRLRMVFPTQKSYFIDAMIAGRSEFNTGLIGFFQLGILQPINREEDKKTSLGLNYMNTQEVDFYAHRLFGFILFDNIELEEHVDMNFRFGIQGSLVEGSGEVVPFIRSRLGISSNKLLNSKQFSPVSSFEFFINPLVSFDDVNPPQNVYRFIFGNRFEINENVFITASIWSQTRTYEKRPELRSKDQVYSLMFLYRL